MALKTTGLTRTAPGKWTARISWRDGNNKKRDTDRAFTVSTEGGLRTETARAAAERERLRGELTGHGDEWTVAEAIDEWLPTMVDGTRTTREPHAKRFRKLFGKLKLSAVPTADVQRWLSELECADDTANNYRASMIALYKYAHVRGRLRGEDPIKKTLTRSTPKSRSESLAELEEPEARRALVGDELQLFFSALLERHPDMYPLVRCQFLLGCRVSEACALKWSDVDWKTGVITIRRSQGRGDAGMGPPKNKKARAAALGPQGLAFLRGHRAAMQSAGWQGHDEWAFPRPPHTHKRRFNTWSYCTVRKNVAGLLRDLGIDLACSTHAMRHSHVTAAQADLSDARGRAADQAMREAVGHADIHMTETYTDNSLRRRRAAKHAARLENRLGEVFELKSPSGGVSGGVPAKKAPAKQG
jgi:integrase